MKLEVLLDGIDRKTIAYYLDGNWHHFAFVVRPESSGQIRQQIFIDGLCSSDFTTVISTSSPLSSGNFIFNFGTAKYDDFLGGLDELAIYDRSLTADEIYQHYLDFNTNQHYSNNFTVAPMAYSTSGVLDPLEFPHGYVVGSENYNNVTHSHEQIKGYPLARFQPGHTLNRNVNYVRSFWMADIENNREITDPLLQYKIPDAVDIQRELAGNWNYYYNFTENTSRFYTRLENETTQVNAAFIKDILKPDNTYPLAGLLFRKQSDVTVGVLPRCRNIADAANDEQCMIACQSLEGFFAIGISPTSTKCGNLTPISSADNPLRFDATTSVTIKSVDFIPQAAGNVIVALRNSGSAVDLITAPFPFLASQVGLPQTLTLNFVVPGAGSYQLTTTATSVGGAYRIATFTCDYPFVWPDGTFSIVGSANNSTSVTNTTKYNSFFNIVLNSSPFPCIYSSLYPRDAGGNKITPNSTSPKGWSPVDADRSVYIYDSQTAVYNLDKFINQQPTFSFYLGAAKSRIALLAENNEIAPKYSVLQAGHNLMDDPDIAAIVGGGDVEDFQSNAKKNIDNDYRDGILSSTTIGLPTNTLFFNYAVDGHDDLRFRWQHLRETNEIQPSTNKYYSTPDIYATKPGRWHVEKEADYHGWRWLAACRYKEITDDGHGNQFNDTRFAPFVSPGYAQASEKDMRPGQYLGLLKAIMLQGVDFFFAYSEPPTTTGFYGSSFCWKIAPPVYAQAIGSRLEHFLKYGVSLPGTMPFNTAEPSNTTPTYWYNCGDVQKLVTVRQDYDDVTSTPLNRFAIVGAMMRYSNAVGSSPLITSATFKFNGQDFIIPIRLQGSTYIYDYQNSSNIIFYQLDKWHQYEHPDHWSKDFEFEAEVNDNTTASSAWVIKSEGINTSVPGVVDLTNVTSYIHFNNIPASPIVYNFQPRQDGVANDYSLWIRARSTGNSGLNFTLTSSLGGTISNVLNNVNSGSWAWYEVTPGSITYAGLSDNNILYTLNILPQNSNIEVDQIRLGSPQYVPCPGINDISNGALASQTSNFNGSTVNLKGTFIIDQDYNFTSCTVYPSPGSQISIMPGNTLTISYSTFTTCYKMWRGIKVQDGGVLTIDNSTLSDAQFAVEADDGSTVISDINSFTNNYLGIYSSSPQISPRDIKGLTLSINQTNFQTNGNFKPAFPGQTYLPGSTSFGTKGYAGVYIENAGFITINSNTGINDFHDMYNGIILYNTSATIQKARFENIIPSGFADTYRTDGSAIYCTGSEYFNLQQKGLGKNSLTSTFDNCHIGIFCQTGATIEDNYFTNIQNAAIVNESAVFRRVDIFNNKIESNHDGILLNQNDGAQIINVYDNEINIGANLANSKHDNIGILVANDNNLVTSNCILDNNVINLYHRYRSGIQALYVGKPSISANTITMYNAASYTVVTPGITIEGCEGASIHCNEVLGEDPANFVYNHKAGIRASISPNSTIACNATKWTEDGILLEGLMLSTNKIKGNNLDEHKVGLHLNAFSVINIQNHTANEWIWPNFGTGGTLAAKNENPNYQLSLFKVDNSPLPLSEPCLSCVTPPNNTWFQSISGTEYDCMDPDPTIGFNCDPILLHTPSCDLMVSELERQVALHFVQLADAYAKEAYNMAIMDLYQKLRNCPVLRNSEQILMDFYNTYTNTVISDLAEVQNTAIDLYEIPVETGLLLEGYYAQLSLLESLYSEYTYQYTHTTDEVIKKQAYTNLNLTRNQIQNIGGLIAEINDEIRLGITVTLGSLMDYNSSIQPVEQGEINEQSLNGIILNQQSSGAKTFTTSQIAIILSIANQCPYKGGPTVFRARGIYMQINNNISFDDRNICLQDGIAWKIKDNNQYLNNISALPNPAKNEVEFNFSLPPDEEGELIISDMMGKVVNLFKLEANVNRLQTTTQSLASGIFSYRLSTKDNLIGSGKLVVLH